MRSICIFRPEGTEEESYYQKLVSHWSPRRSPNKIWPEHKGQNKCLDLYSCPLTSCKCLPLAEPNWKAGWGSKECRTYNQKRPTSQDTVSGVGSERQKEKNAYSQISKNHQWLKMEKYWIHCQLFTNQVRLDNLFKYYVYFNINEKE